MDVVGHQAPAEALDRTLSASFRQHLHVMAAITMREEDALLAIAALDDVMRDFGDDHARGSGQPFLRLQRLAERLAT